MRSIARLACLFPLLTACFGGAGDDASSSADALTQRPADTAKEKFCDVVVAGGSTAAYATALAAARSGTRACLLEPTDWEGGQLTASSVTAIDWGQDPDARPENVSPGFERLMKTVGNPGRCWSQNCYAPGDAIEGFFKPVSASEPNLVIYRNTVVKSVETKGNHVTKIHAIRRTARDGVNGYDQFLHDDLPRWYDAEDDDRFTKESLSFSFARSDSDRDAIFVDATEWGEVLALSGASYSQGAEAVDGVPGGDDRCGQATVFPFIEKYNSSVVDEPASPYPVEHADHYGLAGDTWIDAWQYRRIYAATKSGTKPAPAPGDLSEQNWGPGNDYPYGYLFKSKADTAAEKANWQGGVDLEVMGAVERNAFGWHDWYKAHSPVGKHFSLVKDMLGTTTGLSKMPYIRDTRRSVGLDGYMMKVGDVSGAGVTAPAQYDHVAIGYYALDVHALKTCALPSYVWDHPKAKPFFIPFRALTNQSFSNLLVSGKTMAQSFIVNSTTRLQPVEWASGEAAGVSAAFMFENNLDSRQALARISELQPRIAQRTPIEWTIGGVSYPRSNDALTH